MKKLKVMTVVGTRPEIIRLSRVMEAAEAYVGASALPGSVEVTQEGVADAGR